MDRLFEFASNHVGLVSAFVALLVAFFFVDRRKAGSTVSCVQLVMMMNKEQCVVLDIRDKKDFATGHIKGSLHIPLASLRERGSELDRYKEKAIVVVDKMGQYSSTAGKLLKDLGFQNVMRLQGGIAEWQAQNLPLTAKSAKK